jgi:MFS family permease
MYYSTGILSQALPEAASYVSLGVTVINVIMTFPPVFFVEVCERHHVLVVQCLRQCQRIGQRRILLWSTCGSIISLLLLALSLNHHINIASAIGTLLFVR